MTGQPVSVNGNLVTFTHEPAMTNALLAAFAFVGAKASLYISKVTSDAPLSDGVNRDKVMPLLIKELAISRPNHR